MVLSGRLIIRSVTALVTLSAPQAWAAGQSVIDTNEVSLARTRLPWVLGGSAAVIGGTLYGLNTAWYQGYERTGFHFFDDGAEWLQMDKVGHSYATYTTGNWGYGLLKWAGASEKASLWLGGTLGLTYLTGVELLDSQFEQWGFSWWDMAANVAGTSLFVGQQMAWGQQRITMKYSAHLTDFAEQRPELLGQGLAERILKDYNGQTYWLSFSPASFMHQKGGHLPRWFCFSLGYGAESMTGARNNNFVVEGNMIADQRYRQYFLSVDVDLTRIPTRSKFMRTVFSVLNCVKVPAPAIELTQKGKVKLHPLYF